MSYVPKVYKDQGGNRQVIASGGKILVESGGEIEFEAGAALTLSDALLLTIPAVRYLRTRNTVSEVNAGATLLAAVEGFKYTLISCKCISVGGSAAAVTTVDVLGDNSGAVKLVAFAQASLTQSTVLTDGGSGAAVLADGASYITNDANTAITIGITGSSITTASHIDTIISYTIEAA